MGSNGSCGTLANGSALKLDVCLAFIGCQIASCEIGPCCGENNCHPDRPLHEHFLLRNQNEVVDVVRTVWTAYRTLDGKTERNVRQITPLTPWASGAGKNGD